MDCRLPPPQVSRKNKWPLDSVRRRGLVLLLLLAFCCISLLPQLWGTRLRLPHACEEDGLPPE